MRSNSYHWPLIALLAAVLAAALYVAFRAVYEPQLALRAQQRLPAPGEFELSRLLRLALADRFDLTDTLKLIKMLEDADRVDDAMDVFTRLRARYPNALQICMWHAERLQRYGRWDAAEAQYLKMLGILAERGSTGSRPLNGFWRASHRELAMAQHGADMPSGLMSVSAEDIYRRLAENAMAAGLASDGEERARRLEKSEGFFKSCLAINPGHHATRGDYANLLLQLGRPADSLRQYQLLLETDPRNLGWLVSAAIAAAADRQFAAAESHIRAALRIENRPEWRLEMARFMSWAGKHESAIAEIEALIAEHPETLEYQRNRADFLLNARRHREYLAETALLAARNPLDLDLRLNRLRAMLGLGLYPEAAQEAASLLALYPEHFEAAMLKAEALLWSGDYRSAQADLGILERAAPADDRVLKRLAQAYLWDKLYDKALDYFRRLNPAEMTDSEVAQGFAEAIVGAETPATDDADRIFAMYNAINRSPETPRPLPMLAAVGRALRKTGRVEEAVELLRAAARRAEANLKLRLELADLLQDIGRHEEADRQYRLITSPQLEETMP